MSTIVHTTYCHLVSLTRIHYSYLYPCFRHHCWYQWPHDLEMALTLDLWLLADAVCRAATPWELCDGWLVLLEWTTPSPGPVESQAVKVRQTVNIGSRQSHFLNEWAQNIITNKLDERKGTQQIQANTSTMRYEDGGGCSYCGCDVAVSFPTRNKSSTPGCIT